MTKVNCDETECTFNSDGLCTSDEITVEESVCSTYQEAGYVEGEAGPQ